MIFEWLCSHDYVQSELIEWHTEGHDGEIAGECQHCGKVVWVDVGDNK